MRILLLLICLALYGCKEDVNWESLDKVYFFEKKPNGFETREHDELIKLSEAKELKTDIVKNRFKNSKYKGKKYGWKGGSYYGIAVFKGGERIKLKMSSNYGVYQDMNSGRYYSIEGFENLGSMNWKDLVQPE